MKKFLFLATLMFCGVFTLPNTIHAEDKVVAIGEIDFLAYWSAAKLFVQGNNPYDPQAMDLTQKEIRSTDRPAAMMWNPPWVFPLTGPIALVPARTGIFLWFLASICLYVYCLEIILSIFTITDRKIRCWLFTLAIIYPPITSCLYYGQVSVLVLLGWVLTLKSIQHNRNNLVTGLGIYLTTIKPHLLYLPYIVLLLKKKISMLMLGGAVVVLASLMALAWNNQLFINNIHCLTTMPSAPVFWKTPTLGSYLQEFCTSLPYAVFRFAPHLIGVIVALYLLRKYKQIPIMQMLLLTTPLSIFCNSYGWMYDQVLLLPTIFFAINNLVTSHGRSFTACYITLAANITYLLTSSHQEYGVWYPLFVFLLMLKTNTSSPISPLPSSPNSQNKHSCTS